MRAPSRPAPWRPRVPRTRSRPSSGRARSLLRSTTTVSGRANACLHGDDRVRRAASLRPSRRRRARRRDVSLGSVTRWSWSWRPWWSSRRSSSARLSVERRRRVVPVRGRRRRRSRRRRAGVGEDDRRQRACDCKAEREQAEEKCAPHSPFSVASAILGSSVTTASTPRRRGAPHGARDRSSSRRGRGTRRAWASLTDAGRAERVVQASTVAPVRWRSSGTRSGHRDAGRSGSDACPAIGGHGSFETPWRSRG